MNKRKILRGGLVATAAIGASIAFAATAHAAVIPNADGTIHVDKGDVQALYGYNDAQMQAKQGTVTFNGTGHVIKETQPATCQDGSTGTWVVTFKSGTTYTTTSTTNKQGKITDWTLTPKNVNTTDQGTVPCGGAVASFGTPQYDITSTGGSTGLQVTVDGVTKDLPITPAT